MHSADYAIAKCLPACLSVRLSHAIETVIHILKPFTQSRSSSHAILVFAYQTVWQ